MKSRVFIILATALISLNAQNLQLHYDFGEGRNYFTSTIEMFKPDEFGATFFFFDLDYDYWVGDKSASLAYFEIARYINLPSENKLSATIQYNDGTAPWGALGPIWLAGVSYPIDLGFITINTDVLFRKARNSDYPDGQLTLIWFKSFLKGKLEFKGFLDIWSQDEFGKDQKEMVLLTEPQFWYNLGKHLALGGEIEFSKNFLPTENYETKPTIALKWTF